jgi:hypothetical protein
VAQNCSGTAAEISIYLPEMDRSPSLQSSQRRLV